jgi:hypothetical protein
MCNRHIPLLVGLIAGVLLALLTTVPPVICMLVVTPATIVVCGAVLGVLFGVGDAAAALGGVRALARRLRAGAR